MIGIDISGRSVKAVEVVDRGEPYLRTSCWASLSAGVIRRGVIQDVPHVARVVRQTLGACSPAAVRGREVVGSIPEVQSFVRVLELPCLAAEEMDEAVQWAVRRHIPFDLDRVYIDWELLSGPRGDGRCQVFVGAAQRAVVDPLLAVLDESGLTVVALEIEAQAVARCLLPRDPAEAHSVRGVLVVDLGATATNVVFFDQGAMRFTASVQAGGDDLSQRLVDEVGLTLEAAAEAKARVGVRGGGSDEKIAATLRSGVIELSQKVERVAHEMSVQMPREQRIRAILLSGGGANLPGIGEVFSSIFSQVPVQLGNALVNLRLPADGPGSRLSHGDALHFTTAIGLALRRVAYTDL